MADNIFIDLCVIPQRCPGQVMEVGWQIRQEPPMLFDLIERYPLDRIGLQHSLDQVLHIR